MKTRCTNPRVQNYHRYGGRGITFCERWRSFKNFLADMGERPAGATLDRIDNAKGYEPGNCRWTTMKEQQRNTVRTHLITHNGETLCLTDWAARLGVSPSLIRKRINKGWPVERVLAK